MARQRIVPRRETEEDRWIGRMEDLRKRGPRIQYEGMSRPLGIRYMPTRYADDRAAKKLWRHAYRVMRKRASLHGRTR